MHIQLPVLNVLLFPLLYLPGQLAASKLSPSMHSPFHLHPFRLPLPLRRKPTQIHAEVISVQ